MARSSQRIAATPDSVAGEITLRLISPEQARRVKRRRPRAKDNWAAGYPGDGDVEAVTSLLQDVAVGVDPGAFGPYEIVLDDDLVIGQVGFHAPPDANGTVEVGYGIAESVRNQGHATAALRALLSDAFRWGVTKVEARADPRNVASRRVMEKAGMHHVGIREGLVLYVISPDEHRLSKRR